MIIFKWFLAFNLFISMRLNHFFVTLWCYFIIKIKNILIKFRIITYVLLLYIICILIFVFFFLFRLLLLNIKKIRKARDSLFFLKFWHRFIESAGIIFFLYISSYEIRLSYNLPISFLINLIYFKILIARFSIFLIFKVIKIFFSLIII